MQFAACMTIKQMRWVIVMENMSFCVRTENITENQIELNVSCRPCHFSNKSWWCKMKQSILLVFNVQKLACFFRSDVVFVCATGKAQVVLRCSNLFKIVSNAEQRYLMFETTNNDNNNNKWWRWMYRQMLHNNKITRILRTKRTQSVMHRAPTHCFTFICKRLRFCFFLFWLFFAVNFLFQLLITFAHKLHGCIVLTLSACFRFISFYSRSVTSSYSSVQNLHIEHL